MASIKDRSLFLLTYINILSFKLLCHRISNIVGVIPLNCAVQMHKLRRSVKKISQLGTRKHATRSDGIQL